MSLSLKRWSGDEKIALSSVLCFNVPTVLVCLRTYSLGFCFFKSYGNLAWKDEMVCCYIHCQ